MVKHLPNKEETQVWSLSWEDPLEKEMAIHSSILAWEIPWTEDPGGRQLRGCKESDVTERLNSNSSSVPYVGGNTLTLKKVLGWPTSSFKLFCTISVPSSVLFMKKPG